MKIWAVVLLAASTVAASAADDEDVLRPRGSVTERHITGSGVKLSHHWILGIEAGINYSMFSQTMTRTGANLTDSPENVLESGSGISPYFGIMADFPVTSSVGIQMRALYDPNTVSREFTGGIDATTFNFPPQFFNMETVSKFTLDVTNISIALAARVNLTPALFVTAGPLVQLSMGDITRKDEWRVAHPDSAQWITLNYQLRQDTFKVVSRDTNLATNFIPRLRPTTNPASAYNTTRFGLELGFGGKIDVGTNLWLAPHVRYQYMFTSLNDPFTAIDEARSVTRPTEITTITFSDPKLHSLQIGLALWFGM